MTAKTKAKKKAAPKKKAAKKVTTKKAAASKASPGMSDAAVKAKTGKTWAEWFAALDKAGAKAMSHKEITKLLSTRHKLADWWSQMVTVGYERAKGLRALHQTASGFNASVSRTLATGLDQLFEAWDETRTRASFLKEAIAVTTRNPGKNMRFAWDKDGGKVEVRFTAKGPEKAQITIDHMGLASGAAVKRVKAFWADTLEKMGETALKTSKRVRESGGRGSGDPEK